MELQILGSNSATFCHGRHQTSQILKLGNMHYMIDCGEGTQLQMKKYGAKFSKLHCILISHLHGDHYFGLLGLINTFHLYGRMETLKIIGPPGLQHIITLHLKYSNTTLNYKIDFKEWQEGVSKPIYEDNQLTITTLPLKHKIPCCGFIFKERAKRMKIISEKIAPPLLPEEAHTLLERRDVYNAKGKIKYRWQEVTKENTDISSYAFCSDTLFLPQLHKQLTDVKVIYHEATFLEALQQKAEETLHSTTKQAAQVAKMAGSEMLIIGHFSSRYKVLDDFLLETQSVFPNTHLAREGKVFTF